MVNYNRAFRGKDDTASKIGKPVVTKYRLTKRKIITCPSKKGEILYQKKESSFKKWEMPLKPLGSENSDVASLSGISGNV